MKYVPDFDTFRVLKRVMATEFEYFRGLFIEDLSS